VKCADRFAQNLRRYRRRAGLSQEQVGFRASLHRTEIGLLERGARVPRIDTLIKLAVALDIDPADLLEGIAWRPGNVRHGCFVETEVPGLGTVQRKVKVDRSSGS
jgi:transcriptional regulator with XRE-family HTH domain